MKEFIISGLLKFLGIFIHPFLEFYHNFSFSWNKVRNVLIITTDRFTLGNIVLLSPLLFNLKRQLPNGKVVLMVSNKIDGYLFNGTKFVDEVIEFDILKIKKFKTGARYFKKEIASRKFDIIIFNQLDNEFYYSLWATMARIRYRVGFDIGKANFLNTKYVKLRPGIHVAEANIDILKSLGIRCIKEDLVLDISQQALKFAKDFFSLYRLKKNDFLLGIHPGSNIRLSKKRWNIDRFIEVANCFGRESDVRVLFLGGPDDQDLMERIKARSVLSHIVANDQSILETAALIKRCNLFLSNDTGLMHIAAALKIPIVAIFGPTYSTRYRPWRTPHILLQNAQRCGPCYDSGNISCEEVECLQSLTVDQVLNALHKLENINKLIAFK